MPKRYKYGRTVLVSPEAAPDSYLENLLLVAKLPVLLILQLLQRDPVTVVINQFVIAFDDGLADHLHECLHFRQGSNDCRLQLVLKFERVVN